MASKRCTALWLHYVVAEGTRYCSAVVELYACVPVQYRARDPASRYDRYMLVSFDDPPNAIKVRIRRCPEL